MRAYQIIYGVNNGQSHGGAVRQRRQRRHLCNETHTRVQTLLGVPAKCVTRLSRRCWRMSKQACVFQPHKGLRMAQD